MSVSLSLTGGIACGKTLLATELRRRGWHVIDTDEIAHRLMEPDQSICKNIVDLVGPSILQEDKSIDRKVLGRIVFADASLRARLNKITHPAIRAVWQGEREERARTHPQQPLAVMIPLLFECELEKLFSTIWCVGASRASQLHRLIQRGHSSLEAEQRLTSQLPVSEKMARATLAFWSEGIPSVLIRQLDHILS